MAATPSYNLPGPQHTVGPTFGSGATQLVAELLAYPGAGYTQVGVTLEPGKGVLPTGCVLGRLTATKRYVAYTTGASDGSQVPRGVLRYQADTGTDTTAAPQVANMVITGVLKNSLVSGADSGALTTLKARQDTVLDTFTF